MTDPKKLAEIAARLRESSESVGGWPIMEEAATALESIGTIQKLDKMLCDAFARRIHVEQALLKMAAGKLPLPDAAKCRELAIALGVPLSHQTTSDEVTPLTDAKEKETERAAETYEGMKRHAHYGWKHARQLERTLHAKERELADERAIVDRIWDQLGRPSYEALNGRSIYDLIDELKVKAQSVSAAPQGVNAQPTASETVVYGGGRRAGKLLSDMLHKLKSAIVDAYEHGVCAKSRYTTRGDKWRIKHKEAIDVALAAPSSPPSKADGK